MGHGQRVLTSSRPGRGSLKVACTATLEPTTKTGATPTSGLKHLSEGARVRATDKKASKFEKVKVEKCGSTMWSEVPELAKLLREGTTKWEDLNLDDVDIRMKFAGLFHRGKRTPQRFMMRLKLPNGEINAGQLRYAASIISKYGEDGCADITTRANLQLRGVKLQDADGIIEGLIQHDMGSFQSGMDSVRNLTGSPIAGLDPHELFDTRPVLREMNRVLFNGGRGNEEFANLPRKINVCISPTRDDFPHTQINDLGFEAVRDPASGQLLFNVVVGGYFSIKRNIMSVPLGVAVTEDQLIPFTLALLRVFRDHGPRGDRQKTRLIWLIEQLGFEAFSNLVAETMGPGTQLAPAVHVAYDEPWERRDLLGVHAQKQQGLNWVGVSVPSGRLQAEDLEEFARVAEQYGDGTARLTPEENILFVNVPDASLPAMLAEPIFAKFKVNPGNLERGLVSCTGSQFCGFGLIETKQRAMAVVSKLEASLHLPRPVRIHWTGCPNSCGQAQVADIGLMGAPAKLDGKAVEGVKIFLGGKIGENPELAAEIEAGVPCHEDYLLPKLQQLLVEHFGATPLEAAA